MGTRRMVPQLVLVSSLAFSCGWLEPPASFSNAQLRTTLPQGAGDRFVLARSPEPREAWMPSVERLVVDSLTRYGLEEVSDGDDAANAIAVTISDGPLTEIDREDASANGIDIAHALVVTGEHRGELVWRFCYVGNRSYTSQDWLSETKQSLAEHLARLDEELFRPSLDREE